MADNEFGPDKPCRRTACVAAAQDIEQAARIRWIADGADPADVHADPLPAVGDHLGGVHLDPSDRDHYDGLRVQAMPAPVREAARALMQYASAYERPAPTNGTLRVAVDVALDAAFREIDRLRTQVAHVQVDADRKAREAMAASLSCEHHGEVIKGHETLINHLSSDRDRTERARLALLGEHHAIGQLIAAADAGQNMGDVTALIGALRTAHNKTSAAHKRAFNQ